MHTIRDLLTGNSQEHFRAWGNLVAELKHFSKAKLRNDRAQVARQKRKLGIDSVGLAARTAEFNAMPSIIGELVAQPAAQPVLAPTSEPQPEDKPWVRSTYTAADFGTVTAAEHGARAKTRIHGEPDTSEAVLPYLHVQTEATEAEQKEAAKLGIVGDAKADPNKPWGGKS
jgi:hypothetical protein